MIEQDNIVRFKIKNNYVLTEIYNYSSWVQSKINYVTKEVVKFTQTKQLGRNNQNIGHPT